MVSAPPQRSVLKQENHSCSLAGQKYLMLTHIAFATGSLLGTGPIYRIKLGQQEVVVVSSADHAIELLDRRSPVYSSRPRQIVANDLISKGLRLTFMP